MPIDARCSTYANWVGDDDFDVDGVSEQLTGRPRQRDRLRQQDAEAGHELLDDVSPALGRASQDGTARREAYQTMAKWVADNPPFPGRAWSRVDPPACIETTRCCAGRATAARPAGRPGRIDQNLLVVTAGADHIAPRAGTMPIFDLVSSEDVTHFDRPGRTHRADRRLGGAQGDLAGHRGWLAERSDG